MKELIIAIDRTKNTKEREALSERGKVVTAALLAPETICRSLQGGSTGDDRQEKIVRRGSTGGSSGGSTGELSIQAMLRKEYESGRAAYIVGGRDNYFRNVYGWMDEKHGALLEVDNMRVRWSPQTSPDDFTSYAICNGEVFDGSHCSSATLWLFATTTPR
ncbi:hypothetical protein K469DRAFT_689155 [Zopfia rhizophila CBS 207.26]|uniref:Uncharacterized protein n=1 Tax=Zopfia rhizophila CBS 207.26 TaxID=1314779 RepID=A0A6A6ETM7_9PEZI|nr:hypothetical protein K469DRAFT_689155 [Zopfia rhizophila CBS 207.26]